MHYVALLRNVNQGQRGHPTTVEVLEAFASAGGSDPASLQSNGTIVFGSDEPHGVVSRAMLALATSSGVEREVFWLSLDDVSRIVDEHAGERDIARRELTLHRGGLFDISDPDIIRLAAQWRCTIQDAGAGWIISTNERERESNATPVAERITGLPATSRSLTTLIRVVDRFGMRGR